MVTVIHGDRYSDIAEATAGGGDLWLPAAALEAATGWTLRPEGFCLGDTCVPVPAAEPQRYVRGDAVNVAALWALLERPALHTATDDVWVLGEAAAERAGQLASLEAPDFRLPDVEGRLHALSEQRGRKVLLVTWASW